MFSKSNVGFFDRLIRLGISVVFFYLAFSYPDTSNDVVTSSVLVAIGVINTMVAVIGICPVYLMIGVKTNKEI